MRRRDRWAVALGVAVAVVGTVGLVANMFGPAHFDSRAGEFLFLLGVPIDALVAAYLISRRPDNPLGAYMLVIALGIGLDSPAKAVLNLGVGGVHSALASWALLVDNSTWTFTYSGVALLALHYPDGHLPGPRWGWVRRVVVGAAVVLFVVCTLAPISADDAYPGVRSPLPITLSERASAIGYLVPFLVVVAGIVLGIVGLFVRLRRARRTADVVVSAQLRWLAWSGVVAVVLTTSQGWVDPLAGRYLPWLGNVLSELGPYALVVAIVVAVTRHGLFEIDRVVSRTVSYVLVTALLVGTYVGIVAGLSALLPDHVSSIAVAAGTLAVAALFVPVRRTVQQRIDRRFNRSRFDRAVLVGRFSERLRRDDGLAAEGELLEVVGRTLQPAHAGIWVATS